MTHASFSFRGKDESHMKDYFLHLLNIQAIDDWLVY